LSISRCWALAFPIIAGISFFRWPIMRAWIFAALARLTNSLTYAWKWCHSYLTICTFSRDSDIWSMVTYPPITSFLRYVYQVSKEILLLFLKQVLSNWSNSWFVHGLVIEWPAYISLEVNFRL
jgi:hypothetical protein